VSLSQEPEAATVRGDSALQSDVLESLASAVKYRAWLAELARPHLGPDPIELGSGLGDYAKTWIESGVPAITVTELDPMRLAYLSDRFQGNDAIRVAELDALDPPTADHSCYVAINVLEHIEDHVAVLRGAHQLLRPGGAVVLLVPAFNFAMSKFDLSVGHVRRYTKRSLRQAFTEAGLEVEDVRYVNAPGLFAWFIGMRLLRMIPSDGPIVRFWDTFVVPVARRVERRVRPPFGQSVFVVGRVPR
jgi:SAM-dependent methyltransferase